MDMMTKISVILPVFNGERFIAKAIESVLDQSLKDFELIIVDDGSTDSTREVIDSFDDERIILISQPNQGPGQARNSGLEVASGEYVMFLDADDWFCSDALETAYNEAKSKSTDISIFQIIKYFQMVKIPEAIRTRTIDGVFRTFLKALVKVLSEPILCVAVLERGSVAQKCLDFLHHKVVIQV